jgi:thermitase
VASLVFNARPSLTAADAEKILFTTAVDLGSAGRDPLHGHGRVDAVAAVAAAVAYKPTADTTAPAAAITTPAGGSNASGVATVDVAASDNVGVVKVELFVNGAVLAADTSAPYNFSWDTTALPNGAASLVAVAYDAAGNSSKSAAVQVNVSNASTKVVDTQPPAVKFLSPTSGALLGTSAMVTTSASDDAGAAGLSQSLFIGGKLVATASGTGLSYRWNTRKLAKGTYNLQVTARDAAGNATTTSVSVQK